MISYRVYVCDITYDIAHDIKYELQDCVCLIEPVELTPNSVMQRQSVPMLYDSASCAALPSLYLCHAKNVLGRVPMIPSFVAGNTHPTIPNACWTSLWPLAIRNRTNTHSVFVKCVPMATFMCSLQPLTVMQASADSLPLFNKLVCLMLHRLRFSS